MGAGGCKRTNSQLSVLEGHRGALSKLAVEIRTLTRANPPRHNQCADSVCINCCPSDRRSTRRSASNSSPVLWARERERVDSIAVTYGLLKEVILIAATGQGVSCQEVSPILPL